jgi:hypothetical protein
MTKIAENFQDDFAVFLRPGMEISRTAATLHIMYYQVSRDIVW